jgi:pimeloyl-ACP methyl ester carboxylesterase
MNRVELDDLSIAFEDEGEGIPVVLIHGYPLNRHIWRSQWQGLANTARIIAPDLRNHGDSVVLGHQNPVNTIHPMELLAGDIARLLDALGISVPVIINGLSMGGYAAFAFYRSFPNRVRGLILTATRARSDSDAEKSNRIKAIHIAQDQGIEAISQSMLPRLISPMTILHKSDLVNRVKEIMLSSTVAGVVGDLRGMLARPDSLALTAKVHIPALIVMGRDDQIIPLDEAQAMNDLLPDSSLEIIDGAGHLPNMEQPEIYNRIVQEYIHSLE